MTKLPTPQTRPGRGASMSSVTRTGAPHPPSGCAAPALCGLTNPARSGDRPAERFVAARQPFPAVLTTWRKEPSGPVE